MPPRLRLPARGVWFNPMNITSSLTSSRNLRVSGGSGRVFAGMLGILAMLFLGTALSRAGSGGVIDNGAFFSEQVKTDAVKVIGEMERTLRKGVLVETFKEIPAEVKAGVNDKDKAAMSKMYDQWALKQAKQHGVNGVYVLIVKTPSHLQVEVGTDTQQQAFTLKDRAALVSLMIGKLGAKQNDEALRDGVNFVQATMKSHAPNRARTGAAPVPASASHPAEKSGGWGWIIQFIVIGLVVWVVIGIIRAISGRASGGSAMGQPGMGGGGGGFFSSLIGGMFGAAAGMWMYDQFFSSHGNSAYGAEHNDPNSGTGNDGGFTGQDNDYSGSGGDFGNDSDSGSSGGGDFGGGGDSGGGDF